MTRRPPRFASAWLLAVTVMMATWAPYAHGAIEVLSSDPAIEQGHSSDCPVLHVEARCITSTSLPHIATPPALRAVAFMDAGPRLAGETPRARPSASATTPPTRAPPRY